MSTATETYINTPNRRVEAADGTTFVYRDVGSGGELPLVLLQHFRGNLDSAATSRIGTLRSSTRWRRTAA
jgi:hypothetical protein